MSAHANLSLPLAPLAPLSQPASPPAPAPVTARELERTRETVASLRAQVDALADDVRTRETDIIARIEAGATVDGRATVITRRRQSISWLTVALRELGEDAIDSVRTSWPVSFWKELQLS